MNRRPETVNPKERVVLSHRPRTANPRERVVLSHHSRTANPRERVVFCGEREGVASPGSKSLETPPEFRSDESADPYERSPRNTTRSAQSRHPRSSIPDREVNLSEYLLDGCSGQVGGRREDSREAVSLAPVFGQGLPWRPFLGRLGTPPGGVSGGLVHRAVFGGTGAVNPAIASRRNAASAPPRRPLVALLHHPHIHTGSGPRVSLRGVASNAK